MGHPQSSQTMPQPQSPMMQAFPQQAYMPMHQMPMQQMPPQPNYQPELPMQQMAMQPLMHPQHTLYHAPIQHQPVQPTPAMGYHQVVAAPPSQPAQHLPNITPPLAPTQSSIRLLRNMPQKAQLNRLNNSRLNKGQLNKGKILSNSSKMMKIILAMILTRSVMMQSRRVFANSVPRYAKRFNIIRSQWHHFQRHLLTGACLQKAPGPCQMRLR